MMIPRTLEEWNIDIIRHLIINGYNETDTFDFKAVLTPREPVAREKYNEALSKCVCAFANTNGGFVVFGIEDEKNAKGEDIPGCSPLRYRRTPTQAHLHE